MKSNPPQGHDVSDLDKNNNVEPSFKRPKFDDEEEEHAMADFDSCVVHRNQPIQMSVYRDPSTQQEKVIIIAMLVGGVCDATFSLVGSGPGTRLARIDYQWPAIAIDIEKIFSHEIADNLPSCHPKIEALKKDLERTRDSIDEVPKGSIEFTLPISVQTVSTSISITGKKNKDGVMMLVIELMAFESKYAVKEKKIVFQDLDEPLPIKNDM